VRNTQWMNWLSNSSNNKGILSSSLWACISAVEKLADMLVEKLS